MMEMIRKELIGDRTEANLKQLPPVLIGRYRRVSLPAFLSGFFLPQKEGSACPENGGSAVPGISVPPTIGRGFFLPENKPNHLFKCKELK